jgi:hypothetical protein
MKEIKLDKFKRTPGWQITQALKDHGALLVTYHDRPLWVIRLPEDDVAREDRAEHEVDSNE